METETSFLSYMEDHVLAYKAPLYGRRTAQMKILPFDFAETCRYFKNFTAEEKAYVYGIVGGTPQYLLQMSDKLSIEDNIKNTFCTITQKSGSHAGRRILQARKRWDSNPRAGCPTTRFRVELVMTTSIRFHSSNVIILLESSYKIKSLFRFRAMFFGAKRDKYGSRSRLLAEASGSPFLIPLYDGTHHFLIRWDPSDRSSGSWEWPAPPPDGPEVRCSRDHRKW